MRPCASVPSAVGSPPLWASARASTSPDSDRFTSDAGEQRADCEQESPAQITKE